MKKKSPIRKAKAALSGRSTAARLSAIEKAGAKATTKPLKKRVKKNKKDVNPAIKLMPKHVAARKAKIKAQAAADRRAIAAKKKKKK
jgi:geranylgeranyl pyrophosphate synthase